MASLPERNTRFPVSDAMGISELPRRRGNNSNDVHAILCNLGLVPIGFVSVFMFLDMFYDVYLNLLVRGSQHVGFSSNVGDIGDARFEPRPRHRRFFLYFFASTGQIPRYCLRLSRLLPCSC